MPSSWIKGLITWLSGLVFAILLLAAGTATSAGSSGVGAATEPSAELKELSVELELPGLTTSPSLTERTV